MKKLILISGVLIVAMLPFYSCDKSIGAENKPDDLYSSFDRRAMLENQADAVVISSWNSMLESIDLLQLSIENYTNAPTESNLVILQSDWKNTYQIMKQCELYQFGVVEDGFLWSKLDFWPLRKDAVNEFIIDNNLFDSDVLETKGVTVKGMPVIEYLIFDDSIGNNKIINDFSINEDAIKRKDYLKALCANLNFTAEKILLEWNDNYRSIYVNNDMQGISGSINLTVNNMIQTLNFIKDMKIGKPFGKKDGILYPEEVESRFSKQSVMAIVSNLDGLENLFLGKTDSGNDGLGYDDFLNHLEAKYEDGLLSEKIKSQINECKNRLNHIQIPLQKAIEEEPEKVEAFYLSLKQLLVLIQVDMVNNLGVTLTFTDNDGD
jgi:uncharacterized protein